MNAPRHTSSAVVVCALALALGSCSSSEDSSQPSQPPQPSLLCNLVDGPVLVRDDSAGSGGFIDLPARSASPESSFSFPDARTHLLSFEQQCPSPGISDACCILFLYQGEGSCQTPLDVLVDPTDSFVGGLYEGSGVVSGRMYAGSACQHRQPVIHSVATESSIRQITQRGQERLHENLEVQHIQGRYFLRDISRRVNLRMGGMLSARSYIAVERFHDYQGAQIRYLPRTVYSYPSGEQPDKAGRGAIDALAYTQMVYDFFLDEFGLNSWDNQGASMIAVVESPFPPIDVPNQCSGGVIERASSYNAFFSPADKRIHFTPLVDDDILHTMSVSLDVVAHEWGHAYLDQFSDLVYARESGALSEAFADWTGIRITRLTGAGDWLIGNDLRLVGGRQVALRDTSQPRLVNDGEWKATDEQRCPQPELCNDYCGVHENNGVPNYMFYLLSEGGEAPPVSSSASGIAVEGIGIDKAYQIAFAANRSFWTRNTDFASGRAGMEMAARMLFPADPSIEVQVGRAWAAVGVGSVPPATSTTGTGAPVLPTLPAGGNEEEFSFLPQGQEGAKEIRFQLTAGHASLIGFEQQCSQRDRACCALHLFSQTSTEDLRTRDSRYDTVVDPLSPLAVKLYDDPDIGDLYGVMHAELGCSARAPVLISRPVGETIAQVSQMGQAARHTDIDVQALHDRYFLRDISRRTNAGRGGRMADDAVIMAQQWHDYEPPLIRYEPLSVYSYPAAGQPDTVYGPRAFDALAYTQLTYDFFVENFSVNSWDNQGGDLIAVIEAPFPPVDVANPCSGEVIRRGSSFNAFYSLLTSRINFTPMVGNKYLRTLSVSPEVVAHEWAHAYLDSFANLAYSRESGALNEAFADWTGIRIKRLTGAGGWLMGDDIGSTNGDQVFFRDLSAPRSLNDQQWKPVDRQNCARPQLCNDYCGIHRNNGVPNYMFYLLSEGGSARPTGFPADGDSIRVAGIGIDKAYQIAFLANRIFWTRNTDFASARAGMEMAARILFPTDPGIEVEVGRAWAAVGVGSVPAPAPVASLTPP